MAFLVSASSLNPKALSARAAFSAGFVPGAACANDHPGTIKKLSRTIVFI